MEKKNAKKSKKIRSVAYPAVSLEQALTLVEKLKKNAGLGPYSRLSASEGLGYSSVSGTSAARIAALAHFGLLTKKGGVYKQSELTERVLLPNTEEEKRAAIIEAVKTPKLYSKLLERFSGQILPVMLKNLLVREFKVNERVVDEVEQNFQASMEFAGLLKDGVLLSSGDVEVISAENPPVFSNGHEIAKDESNVFKFQFVGGVYLVVPKNERTSAAIIMGELKQIKEEIELFAERFLTEENKHAD